MNDSFRLTFDSTEPVIEREYAPGPIKLEGPYKIGLDSFNFYFSAYNITEKNNILSLHHWRYTAADKNNVYYTDKIDDNMKYEQQFYKIPPGNYELDEIIDVLSGFFGSLGFIIFGFASSSMNIKSTNSLINLRLL